MDQRILELVLDKINRLERGVEIGLRDLFGEDWDIIGSTGNKIRFGREFKALVLNGDIPNIQHRRINNNGRFDMYQKID